MKIFEFCTEHSSYHVLATSFEKACGIFANFNVHPQELVAIKELDKRG